MAFDTGDMLDDVMRHTSSMSDEGARHDLMETYKEKANRLNAISAVYQKADRIITGSEITVTVVSDPNMETNAQNNGVDITLNSDLINDLSDDGIIALHGTNYHELAHLLFTPRAGSSLRQTIIKEGLQRAFGVLEEARAERLLTLKYPSTKPYLESNALVYKMGDDPSQWGETFHLVTGLTYLPLALRQHVADKFIRAYGRQTAQRVHRIIHEFRTLVFPRDFDRAIELCREFAELIGKDEEPKASMFGKPDKGNGCEHDLTRGRPMSGKEQEELQRSAKGEPTEDMDNKPADGEAGNGVKDGEAGNGVKDGGDYTGEEVEFTEEDSAIAKQLSERLEEIKHDINVRRDLKDVRKAIVNSDELRASIDKQTVYEQPPANESVVLARRFGYELERIVKDNEPRWDRFMPSGKLNVGRTMNPDINAIGQMFDVWDIGNTDTDIEAVILFDHSGSMGGLTSKVCQNAWIIKRAIERINGSVTVYSFETFVKEVYSRDEKAKPNSVKMVRATGGTNPFRGFMEAERLLTVSKKPIKILFVITDGEWERAEDCDMIIDNLNKAGVITANVFINDYDDVKELIARSHKNDEDGEWARRALKNLRHKAKVFSAVAMPNDILEVAKAIVKEALVKRR